MNAFLGTWLPWLLILALLGITSYRIARWNPPGKARFGPCMAWPEKASRRRRLAALLREVWYRLPRTTFVPPRDGEPLTDEELFADGELSLMWELGMTHPDPVIPPRKDSGSK